MDVATSSTTSAVTAATAGAATPRRNSGTVVDLSRPTFASSPSVNANPGADALIKLASNTIPELRTLLVMEHGCVVAEYTRPDVDPTVPYNVWSTTKSWLSLMIGLMIQDGKVGLDESLGDIFDDCNMWRQNDDGDDDGSSHNHNNNRKMEREMELETQIQIQMQMEEDLKFRQAITIRDLLTMTSGLQLPAITTDAAGNEMWSDGGGTLTEALLEPSRIVNNNNDQAQKFYYLGANNIMSYICKQRTEYASPREYLAAKVFPSLGISNDAIEWRQNKEGMEYAYHGLLMTPTQMAKLGQLFLQGGRSNVTHTLINKDWVTASTSLQAGSIDYGYLWWVYPTMFCAKGMGGQDVCVSPLTDRVVVQQRDFNFDKTKDEAITAMDLAALALTSDLLFSDSNP